MLKSQDSVIYKQIQARYCKVVWTHKIQECQADIYLKKSNNYKTISRVLSALSTTGALVTLTKWFNPLYAPIFTAVCSATLLYCTLTRNESGYERLAQENKHFAALMHNLRNEYESLMTDIMSGIISGDEIIRRRNLLEQEESRLYTDSKSPHSTPEAVKRARKALFGDKDSSTSDEEVKILVPKTLQN